MAARKRAKKAGAAKVAPAAEVADTDIYQVQGPRCKVFSSGCTLLDKALGGGWAYGRMANVVGDKSTGKTLVAIEAVTNFLIENPDARVIYAETEAAFDRAYAATLGLPASVEFPKVYTVEDVMTGIDEAIADGRKTLYVLDSLDALSDAKQQARAVGKATYGTKAAAMSVWFCSKNQATSEADITLFIVSQTRDNIGGSLFGPSQKRSGGKAMDFYATHVVWLHHLRRLDRTVEGQKLENGVRVKAKVEKNKVGVPFRSITYDLIFGYGIADAECSLAWLMQAEKLEPLGLSQDSAKKLLKQLPKMPLTEYVAERDNINAVAVEAWDALEEKLRPIRSKYQ